MYDKIEYGDTIATKVTDHLRADILGKKIEAGRHITIKQVAEGYGVGTMPVREAFRTLEGEGLLKIIPYKGAVVEKFDVRFAIDTYQIVCSLETLITMNAGEKIPDDAVERLYELNNQMISLADKDVNERRKYKELNRQFHAIISEYNENKRANDMYVHQHSILRDLRATIVHSKERILSSTEQHNLIIKAIKTKDWNMLRDAIEQHNRTAMENYISQFTSSE